MRQDRCIAHLRSDFFLPNTKRKTTFLKITVLWREPYYISWLWKEKAWKKRALERERETAVYEVVQYWHGFGSPLERKDLFNPKLFVQQAQHRTALVGRNALFPLPSHRRFVLLSLSLLQAIKRSIDTRRYYMVCNYHTIIL